MNAVEFIDYSFTYPKQETPVLSSLSFSVPPASFTVLCGLSGSGKSTLLRCIKPELAPVGQTSGRIAVFNMELSQLSAFESAASIGFVMQSPDNQLVTDTVWHELAFGLENLGLSQEIMRRRVAETAHFFGIGSWFEKRTSELSGGQKQLLNLAAVMVMQPRLLVLDEPTAQLDPIAAKEFLQALHRVNSELGTTVLICEHFLEELLPMANRVLFLESGALAFDGSPQDFITDLCKADDPFLDALPAAVNIARLLDEAACDGEKASPITVHDGRLWLQAWKDEQLVKTGSQKMPFFDAEQKQESAATARTGLGSESKPVLQAKDIWFRYNKHDEFVLQNASIDIYPGRVHAIVGGNASGKSTLLFALAGVRKPARGRIIINKDTRVAVMAQNPKTLFVCDTVKEDLLEWKTRFQYDETAVCDIIDSFGLTKVADHHPYDLSGGELQKAALAKLLLTKPDVLLLDEPVKGVDIVSKAQITDLLRDLARAGKAVVVVSHELDFVAQLADVCSMMFAGAITCDDDGHQFFLQNMYFTTGVNRITRGMLESCVTLDDIRQISTALRAQALGEE